MSSPPKDLEVTKGAESPERKQIAVKAWLFRNASNPTPTLPPVGMLSLEVEAASSTDGAGSTSSSEPEQMNEEKPGPSKSNRESPGNSSNSLPKKGSNSDDKKTLLKLGRDWSTNEAIQNEINRSSDALKQLEFTHDVNNTEEVITHVIGRCPNLRIIIYQYDGSEEAHINFQLIKDYLQREKRTIKWLFEFELEAPIGELIHANAATRKRLELIKISESGLNVTYNIELKITKENLDENFSSTISKIKNRVHHFGIDINDKFFQLENKDKIKGFLSKLAEHVTEITITSHGYWDILPDAAYSKLLKLSLKLLSGMDKSFDVCPLTVLKSMKALSEIHVPINLFPASNDTQKGIIRNLFKDIKKLKTIKLIVKDLNALGKAEAELEDFLTNIIELEPEESEKPQLEILFKHE